MAKPITVAPPWGTAGFYAPQNYQDPLPWGAANPLGGGAVPWQGAPRLNAAGLATFAANGFTPEIPTQAESFNEWLRQAQDSLQWVQDGSSADDADAHIVETTALGKVCVQAIELTLGVFGVAGAPVLAPNGLTVTAGKTLLALGDVILGDTAGDAIIVPGSVTLQSPTGAQDDMTFSGSTLLSGGAGSTCRFPTLDTSTGGVVLAGSEQWYTATPGFPETLGFEYFDGLRKALGDGTSEQPIYAPYVVDVETATTGAVVTDIAGLAVTLTLPKDRRVVIEVFAKQEVDLAGEAPNIRIRAQNDLAADIVPLLKAGDADAAISTLPVTVTNGDRRPNSVEVSWSPDEDVVAPVNDTWTIQVQHGVTAGGSVDTTACILRVTYR